MHAFLQQLDGLGRKKTRNKKGSMKIGSKRGNGKGSMKIGSTRITREEA
jgi:hypothetical protein